MMIHIHVRVHAAGMHAGVFELMHAVLGHQISRVYLNGLSAQSDLIFLVDLCLAMVNCIYWLIFPRVIIFILRNICIVVGVLGFGHLVFRG